MANFEEEFEKLTNAEKRHFTEYLNELLFKSFVVRKKYDRTTGFSRITETYSFINLHFHLFEDYLSYAGLDLIRDDEFGVIYIFSSSGENRLKVDVITTLFVYVLRHIYEKALATNPTQTEVLVDTFELKHTLQELGIVNIPANKRITALTTANALRFLADHNVLARAKNSFSDPNYSFYILPSIRYIIDTARMNNLEVAINKEINGEGSEEESL